MNELSEILKFYHEIGVEFLEVREEKTTGNLEDINKQIFSCRRCGLHKNKQNYVPGEGKLKPDIMFIGEGPGEEEDKSGIPFVGPAGKLLEKLISRMGYSREEVFIGNVVKCRPLGNRNPDKEEIQACLPYLWEQIKIIKPKVIVCLGRVALNNMFGENYSIMRKRGQLFRFKNIPLIPTFHPSYILHQKTKQAISKAKWQVWSDMQKVLQTLKKF